ncbi:MoaD/ThiS family protein [Paraflavitalea sp. CAU 1676]|uniref:MoaD/ThiS family protein n=1 Tax=Paraflavitalea sp. CAU 1676 TaxID=3032598 RepID=UPI0023DB76C9|nr:MoaD/ThiS family protein [Paraflavitalea sp. CAU 1676]MDF2188048.1 MoaD/ThiS family protein [Paraflavitalea sp. CAU 1676]
MEQQASVHTNTINIRLFGQFAEMAGSQSIDVDWVADTDSLRRVLEARFPTLQQLPYLVAVDKDIASDNMVLHPHAVVALLPPYSGG